MGNALVSVIALAIMIAGVFAVLGSLFDSNATTSRALVDEGIALSGIVQARVAATRAQVSRDDVRTNVDITISNTGNVGYGDFDEWNITVEYWSDSEELVIKRLSFSDTTADNRWMLRAIYKDAASALAEIVDANVLNPMEEMVIRLRLNPASQVDRKGRVVVTPPIGEPTTIFFSA